MTTSLPQVVAMLNPFARGVAIILACVLLAACSAARLGYNNAESLAHWWLDHYLDMNPEQDALARERLARLHGWHRRTQLPDYAKGVADAQQWLTKPSAEGALALLDGTLRRGQVLADQALPDIADLLPTLTQEQLDRMARRMADKNTEFAKEARLDENEDIQRAARAKRLVERAEYWLGNLSDTQSEAVRQLIVAQPSGSAFWFQERQRRQQDWLNLARKIQREQPHRDRVMALLKEYAIRFDLPSDNARRAQALALRRASAELSVAIIGIATGEQRAYAKRRLEGWQKDFEELARES